MGPPQHGPASTPPPVPPSVRGLGPLLRVGGLRRLATVRLLSSFGDGAFQGALANIVLFDPSRQSAPSAIATGIAVSVLPYSVIGPFAGALLDRWSRRQVIVWANLLRAVIIAVLALLLGYGVHLWVLFTVALVVTGAGRFVGSGLSASLPHLVSTDSLVGANSLVTTAGSMATVIGGGTAIGLRGIIGGGALQTALITGSVLVFYLGAGWVATRFRRNALGPDETDEPPQPLRAVLEGFAAGLHHVTRRATVGVNIALVMLVRFCFGLATLSVLLLFRNYFTKSSGLLRGGIAGVGEVLAVSGFGLFLGAVVTSALVRLLGRTRYVVVLCAVAAAVVLLAGSRFTQLSTMITALLLAFTYQSTKICADTVVQADSDDAHIGRVFALYDTANNVCYVGGFVIGVTLLSTDGRSLTMIILVVVLFVLAAVFYPMTMARFRRSAAPF